MVETARVADWDAEVERLLAEARSERSADIDVPLPGSLSASALLRLQEDAGRVRPRAGPPDAAAAVARGAVRHAVPRLGRGPLRPAAAARPRRPARAAPTSDIADEADLDAVIAAFEQGPFADRVPARRRGVVRARPRRPGGARPDRRGLPGGRRLVPRRRLEDQPRGDRRPAPARDLPARLGRAGAACRSSRSARRSTTCAPARRCSRTTCRTGPGWRAARRHARLRRVTPAAKRDLDHVAERLLALGRGRLLAGDDVVGDGADRTARGGRSRRRSCRARWPPSRSPAPRARPSGSGSSGRGGVERVAAVDQARRARRPTGRRTRRRRRPRGAGRSRRPGRSRGPRTGCWFIEESVQAPDAMTTSRIATLVRQPAARADPDHRLHVVLLEQLGDVDRQPTAGPSRSPAPTPGGPARCR